MYMVIGHDGFPYVGIDEFGAINDGMQPDEMDARIANPGRICVAVIG